MLISFANKQVRFGYRTAKRGATMYKLVQVDLFGTLIQALPKDPVLDFLDIVGNRSSQDKGLGVDPDSFLMACLTTDADNPRDYADLITSRFGLARLSDHQLKQFESLLEAERACVAQFWDVPPALEALSKAGFIVCANSNLWPFAAEHIFTRLGLAKHFHKDGLVLSYKEGRRKDDPEIYMVAPRRFNVDPRNSIFVGDSLRNDCLGPMSLGIRPFLLDRTGAFDGQVVPDGVTRIRSLLDLTPALVG